MYIRIIVGPLIGVIVGGLLLVTPISAQNAECPFQPLTTPLFDGTPVAQLATPIASSSAATLTEDEASEVIEGIVACANTGDPHLVWAMYSPGWFARTFADSETHYLPALEQHIEEQMFMTGAPLVLEGVDSVEPTQDGRMRVTFTLTSANQRWTDTLVLIPIDGLWYIDDVELGS